MILNENNVTQNIIAREVNDKEIASKSNQIRMVNNKNHIYKYVGWMNQTKVLKQDDISAVTVVLEDVTKGEVITRKGKIYMLSEPVIFINSLEGSKDVQVCLHTKDEQGRVKDDPDSSCKLWPI